MTPKLLATLAVAVLGACAAGPPAPEGLPDLILHGGPILVMDDAGTRVEALAVRDRRILAIGDESLVLGLAGPDTIVVDLGGLTVVPGFVEAHGVLLQRADADAEVVTRASTACASRGLTTIQEGAASAAQVVLLTDVANSRQLEIDAVAFPRWETIDALGEQLGDMDCVGTFRLGGMALAADATLSPDDLRARVARCFENGWHVHATVRSSGELDALLDAVRPARAADGASALRVVAIVHTADVRDDQLDAMRELDLIPSFCATTEPGSIALAEPARARGVRFTLHDDAADRLPDPLGSIAAACAAGLPVDAALRAWTIDAAHQLRMDGRKGSLEPGKLADLVILSGDPTAVAADEVAAIQVRATIKYGATIYTALD